MQLDQPHLPYSIIIERTKDCDTFCYFSPDLPGFAGSADTEADCLSQALKDIPEFLEFLQETNSPVPPPNPEAVVTYIGTDTSPTDTCISKAKSIPQFKHDNYR